MVEPYFPDVVSAIVAKVSDTFEADSVEANRFKVLFNNGLHEQASKDLAKETWNKKDVLIWLVMPYSEDKKKSPALAYGVNGVKLLLCHLTDINYSQKQREELIIKPKLFPVYNALLSEFKNSLLIEGDIDRKHKRRVIPYWGGGESMQTNTSNLFERYSIDAIELSEISALINYEQCKPFKTL